MKGGEEEEEEEEEEEQPGVAGLPYNASLTGNAGRGANVFATRCASCHGADGRGTLAGPRIDDEVPEKSDKDIWEVIQDGDDEMPAVPLSAQETADVIAHLRAVFGAEGDHD